MIVNKIYLEKVKVNQMNKKSTYVFDNKEVVFEYETHPEFIDVISIITNTVDAVVSDIVEYAPYLTEYMIQYNMIHYLTDVVLPKDLNECFRFINESEVFDILEKGTSGLYEFIKENVDKMIEFRKSQIVKKSKCDDLVDALINLINTIRKEFDGLNINEVLDRLEKVGFLPGMTEDEIVKKILQIRAEEEIKEKKNNSK